MLCPRSVLITGANRGIGLELTRQLLRLRDPPEHVFATCRQPESAVELKIIASANPSVHILKLDVTQHDHYDDVVYAVRTRVNGAGLNLLINNAGIGLRESSDFLHVTAQNMREAFETNALAPLMISKAFFPLLKIAVETDNTETSMSCSKAAIINISSKKGSCATNTKFREFRSAAQDGAVKGDFGGGRYPYRTSKATLNMVTSNMAIDLKRHRILAVALHPGWVRTTLGGPDAPIDVRHSVEGLIQVMGRLNEDSTGTFHDYEGVDIEW